MTAICAILLDAAAVFLACLIVHVVWWRVRRPVAYRQWVPALAVVFLLFGPALAWSLLRMEPLRALVSPAETVTAWLAVMLLHLSASLVYIIGYTLVSAFSPSVEILKLIDRTPAGLTRAEIDLPFLREALGGNRVDNLLAGGMVCADGDDVRLGPRATTLTRLVLFYRHAIGLPDGTGG